MDRKRQIFMVFFTACLLSTLLCVGTGCDAILPDDFKEKDFATPGIDARAHALLSRVVARNAGQQIIVDSLSRIVQARTLESFVDSATRANSTDNKIISLKSSVLVDSLKPGLVKDSVMLVLYPRNQQTVYSVLEIVGQPMDIYLYTSLENYAGNTNEYVSVQLVRIDTSVVSFSDTTPMENLAGSIDRLTFTSGGNTVERTVRILKARYQYHLDARVYLVRFTLSNPATFADPTTIPGPAFFKILIFSK